MMRLQTIALLLTALSFPGCNVDNEHTPVDHKDDSADYRTQVWDAVQQRVGSALTPVASDANFAGVWDVYFDMFGNRQPMFRYDFKSAATVEIVSLQGNDQTPQPDQYVVKREGQLSICGESYHAATTENGELVLFNGDSSLVLIAIKR
ncbi:hypothetical protein [Rosistilla oblonga]|uniref:hypothetical protein n=1 Tax=Rosistilla oblonga TaxID=2527990 RepID=UPI003A977A7C